MAVELWMRFLNGGVIAVGTLARSLYGYYTAKSDNKKVTFDWKMFSTEVGSAVGVAFLTGYFLDSFQYESLVLGFFTGAGLGSTISKFKSQ